MVKSTPIPSLKKPSATLPVAAMAAFVGNAPDAPSESFAPSETEKTPQLRSVELEEHSPSNQTAEELVPAPRIKSPSKASKKSGRHLQTRSDGSVARKVTIYLEPELDKQLSLHAVTNAVDRSEIVSEALSRFLKRVG